MRKFLRAVCVQLEKVGNEGDVNVTGKDDE